MKKQRKPSLQTIKVLETLGAAWPGWSYGYDISKETGLKSGSLYPILMRLDDRQWVESVWENAEEGKPARHMYRLTSKGKGEIASILDSSSGLSVSSTGRALV